VTLRIHQIRFFAKASPRTLLGKLMTIHQSCLTADRKPTYLQLDNGVIRRWCVVKRFDQSRCYWNYCGEIFINWAKVIGYDALLMPVCE